MRSRIFKEKVDGKQYSVEDAKKLFIDYSIRSNCYISSNFLKCKLTVHDKLPNNQQSILKIGDNSIDFVRNISIITLFHELKHLADSWQDESGALHPAWVFETNYCTQLSFISGTPKIVQVDRGVRGLAMSNAVAELFAQQAYLDIFNYDSKAYLDMSKNRPYADEIIYLKKIAIILGLNISEILTWSSPYGRQQLAKKFSNFDVKYSDVWRTLELWMDYCATVKYVKNKYPDYKVSQKSFERAKEYKKHIDDFLDECMSYPVQQQYYSSQGVAKIDFDRLDIFRIKISAFNSLKK